LGSVGFLFWATVKSACLSQARASVFGPLSRVVNAERMNRKRILVADDEEVIRMLIRLVLGTDYEIVEVADGEEAWQKLVDANFQFDLVMVDWKMPRLGGEELLARIQKHNVSMPVLVLTGNIQ